MKAQNRLTCRMTLKEGLSLTERGIYAIPRPLHTHCCINPKNVSADISFIYWSIRLQTNAPINTISVNVIIKDINIYIIVCISQFQF